VHEYDFFFDIRNIAKGDKTFCICLDHLVVRQKAALNSSGSCETFQRQLGGYTIKLNGRLATRGSRWRWPGSTAGLPPVRI